MIDGFGKSDSACDAKAFGWSALPRLSQPTQIYNIEEVPAMIKKTRESRESNGCFIAFKLNAANTRFFSRLHKVELDAPAFKLIPFCSSVSPRILLRFGSS